VMPKSMFSMASTGIAFTNKNVIVTPLKIVAR